MDSKKVQAFLEVIACGSITSAAEKLGYSQPGLTNMMNSLESELGVCLLTRSKAGVAVTRDGWELIPSFKRFVEADRELCSYAERIREKNMSTLRIGAYSSASSRWLPVILSKFRALNIGTDTAISSSDISLTYDAVKNGTVDCAIASLEADLLKDLCWIPLMKDELVAILPMDYVTEENSFPVIRFDEEDFLMPAGGFDMDILPALNQDNRKSKAHIRYTNLSDATIVSMVAHKLGFSIMSRLVMESIHDNVRVLPLFPPAYREMGILLKADRLHERNISSFVELAKNTVKEMYNSKKNS